MHIRSVVDGAVSKAIEKIRGGRRRFILNLKLPNGIAIQVFLRNEEGSGIKLDGPPRFGKRPDGRRPGVVPRGRRLEEYKNRIGSLEVELEKRPGVDRACERAAYDVVVERDEAESPGMNSEVGEGIGDGRMVIEVIPPVGKEAWLGREAVATVQQLVEQLRASGATVAAEIRG